MTREDVRRDAIGSALTSGADRLTEIIV